MSDSKLHRFGDVKFLGDSYIIQENGVVHHYYSSGTMSKPIIELDHELKEYLGRAVRETWIEWAKGQPNPKLHHLLPWEKLLEEERRVDRLIGEGVVTALLTYINDLRLSLIDKQTRADLTPTESVEFQYLQRLFFALMDYFSVRPLGPTQEELEAIFHRLESENQSSK